MLRRGFKADTNWYARSLREELGLRPHDALSPWALAAHLGFPIVRLSDFITEIPAAVTYLLSSRGCDEFSAVTLFVGSARLIVHNDGHDPKRQAADISHELAHGVLLHPPKPPLDENGSRHYDPILEAEANWLGPALLVSEEAALHIVRIGLSLEAACERYGVSAELLRMRLNVTAAYVRVGRRQPA